MREVQLHSSAPPPGALDAGLDGAVSREVLAKAQARGGERADGGISQLEKPLRVGELARRTGKTVRALHLYEELDLLHPVHRSKGGFRLYAPSAVARVQWIAKLQDAGFSLQELCDFLHTVGPDSLEAASAASAMRRVREVFAERLAEIRAQMSRLVQLEGDLVESLEYLEDCRSCKSVEHHGCGSCGEPAHVGKIQPLLVAGIQRG